MISKNKKAQKGPSWLEVGLGALLSVILGVVLGVAYLASKTVQTVKDIPTDAPAGAVYYIEGSRDFSRDAVIKEKRKDFTDGQSISVDERDLNAFITMVSKPPSASAAKPAKPGDKAPPPPADQKAIDVGTLNARIHQGKIQFGDSVTFNVFGVSGSFIVQARGTISKHGSGFAFDPEEIYVGGCPCQRLLFIKDFVVSKLLFAQPFPDDVAAAWSKLSDVVIEGSTLRLKAP